MSVKLKDIDISMPHSLHKNWRFLLRISSLNERNPQESADLATFTEEILNGKLHFLWSVRRWKVFQELLLLL